MIILMMLISRYPSEFCLTLNCCLCPKINNYCYILLCELND
ncbi:hypothetical protein A1OE_145 [Candidatus Endolissoclinum faulkneri L2]|uniref:Uncharacterized protein n=1 Tax=Candidatus Endolissoclinum faulkneri L2 TaxID=1193729 RepID=K7YP27_9PROT|nr:hypothetical protein A1OE_145 [Candidatus Endolissoclinum faulkneri L2]